MTSKIERSGRTVAYTDGGASPNPGPGGWGVVLIPDGSRRGQELSGCETTTTNNRMELTAAIRALEALPVNASVDVYTDSTYVRQGITKWIGGWIRRGWKRRDSGGLLHPVKNEDLWRRLHELERERDVAWHWVKGHAGHRHNERADELASAEIARLRQRDGALGGSAGADEGPDPTAHDAEIEATIKVGCDRSAGAWAIELVDRERATPEVLVHARRDTTANRLELEAALEVLGRADAVRSLAFRSGDYLRRGASEWLDGWKRRGWRTGAGGPVKNADLWRRIDHELSSRSVIFLPLQGNDTEKELAKRAREARRPGA